MFEWLRSLFKAPQPSGPPRQVAAFTISNPTITQGVIVPERDGWRVDCAEKQTIRLFEVPEPGVEQCMLTYRARMKTEDIQGRAYLEMWCRIPGRGEFFSKGIHNAVKGTNDWASCEIPFNLKKGQKPDLLKLNLVVEGTGKLWIQDVQILQTPME